MPTIRSDIVDIYIIRCPTTTPTTPTITTITTALPASSSPGMVEFLQLFRARGEEQGGWHPVMGHIDAGESALDCARRELAEEVGLGPDDPHLLNLWALEQVHPYFVAGLDAVILSPRFCAEVLPAWAPRLNAEHDRFRWISAAEAPGRFLWPGQRAVIAEIIRLFGDPALRDALRI